MSHCQPIGGSTLVQYFGNLLVCSSRGLSNRFSVFACFLAENGEVSKDKLQFVKQSVRYLGHIIISEGCNFSPDRIQRVFDIPKPFTLLG